ncbi:MmgE/PrpD family protein [Salipiger bermudensis]|uniref:MmgE/PrpD family protein n=1 Tax=Salipiger bermudensis TaxID=344736 RepID=UPI001CD7EB24|nr:MmgE/PrpD family protein [Salipiger bermudensis]MCA1283772.1 MmgE/PrpD family protein [Salipiger bermudensis]
MTKPQGLMPDLVQDFAAFAVGAEYDRVPDEARDKARKSLLDTLGVCLAASGLEPAARGMNAIVHEHGGAPDCTLLGFGGRAPAMMAAMNNGALAHCLDYDDQTPWGQHCSSSIVPAALAVAERQGGVSGRTLITAIAVGQDLFARMRRNVAWKKDWNLSTVLAIYGATAACGRVMGFDQRRMIAAFSAASQSSAGVMELVSGTGSDLRAVYAGFSAKGAVLAALLAEQGASGLDTLFEGPNGVFPTYFASHDSAGMRAGLGAEFQGGATLYKRWPAVGTSHSHMKAAIDIVTAEGIAPDEIAEIRLAVGDFHMLGCTPLEKRRAPETLVDAKFAMPFLVAVAIVRRGMSVADFSPERLRDPEVLATAAKVVPVPDPDLDWTMEMPPGRVEIVLADGRRFTATGTQVPGNADAPMSWDDVNAKFRECCAAALHPPAPDTVARVCAMAQGLDGLDDATEILRVLTQTTANRGAA